MRRLATSTSSALFAATAATTATAMTGSPFNSTPTTAITSSTSLRGIRTQIPPRPLVTVVTYLDRSGNPIRNRVETELAIVKTRDNKYWLQRIMPDGSNIRWRLPGLDKMKNAQSFESFSMHDIDDNGGVQVPVEVVPWARQNAPEFADGILLINSVKTQGKVTRKDRRYWNRELYAAVFEHEHKYASYWNLRAILFVGVGLYFFQRLIASFRNDRSFFDSDVFKPRGRYEDDGTDVLARYMRFGENHPEHTMRDERSFMASPGQMKLGVARADLHGEDVHTPDVDNMFMWQLMHLMNYNHWPKPLDA